MSRTILWRAPAAAASLLLVIGAWLGLQIYQSTASLPLPARPSDLAMSPSETPSLPEPISSDVAIIEIPIDTAYDDSVDSLADVRTWVAAAPARQTRLKGTISELILNEYGVSAYDKSKWSYLDSTYRLIEGSILELNKADRPESLQEGRIFVPTLPKRTPPQVADDQPGIPTISMFANSTDRNDEPLAAPVRPEEIAFTRPAELLQSARANSSLQFSRLEVPVTTALTLLRRFGSRARVISHPVVVALSQTATNTDDNDDRFVVNPALRDQVQVLLKNATREVFFIVADTGWPTAAIYADSRFQLKRLLNAFWKEVIQCSPPLCEPPRRPDDAPWVPPRNGHAVNIADALADLVSFDAATSRIRTVYVPLTLEQNARPLLLELLQAYEAYRLLYPEASVFVGQDPRKRAAAVRDARAFANTVVNRIPQAWYGTEVRTDKALFDAYLRVLHEVSKRRRVAFFLNASWTVGHEGYLVQFPSPMSGVVVAAAGNTAQSIDDDLKDFAQRSIDNMDTLAVLNSRPGKGLICGSSRIADRYLHRAFAVGFDGVVKGTTICGTSFAAPRVGWFLAVAEATRTTNFDLRVGLNIFDRLGMARNNAATGWDRLWFEPERFLSFTTH